MSSETEKIQTKDFSCATSDMPQYTNCYYQFTEDDIKAVKYTKDLLETSLHNIIGMQLRYDGEVLLIDDEGFECIIEEKLMYIEKDSCTLQVQEKKGDFYEIITNY